jgi:ABC-type multidrug transport system fused ATPase/permease subunit
MMSELGGMRRSAEDVGDDAVIDVRGLRMRYGSVDVLRGIEFVAHRGEVLTLLGPNGAGKTTTIEILEGFRMRSALLPGSLVSVMIGDAWRHLESLGVLGLWAVIGLVLAPMVLWRMARRESGSSVTERRERAMQRVH